MAALRVLFFGTPAFAATCLESLLADERYQVAAVVTQPDREAGRGKKLTPSPVKSLALTHNLAVLQPQRLRKELPQFLESLRALGTIDVGVVVAFGQILPQAVLDYPLAGCVNVHGSLLPRWRGAAPIQRAIMAGDRETGIGLMRMEAGLDTGAVYSEQRLAIEPTDDSASLAAKLADLGGRMLRDHLSQIAAGTLPARPQSEAGVTYADKITNEEARIDWRKSAREIELLVRGLSPAPGAFSFLRGQRLKIYRGETVPGTAGARPGEVIQASKSRLEVQCADGALSLLDVQLQGKKRMPVEEFLKSGPVTTHEQLKDS